MTGVIPSEEFNEQLKRTVRETVRRQRENTGPSGRWHKKGGGGAGASILSFLIISSDPTLRSALVETKQRAFAGQAFGSTLNDTVVTVYDTDGCFLNEPNVDLTGRRGKAVLMNNDDEAGEIHFGGKGLGPTKYWNVLSLCCPQVACE